VLTECNADVPLVKIRCRAFMTGSVEVHSQFMPPVCDMKQQNDRFNKEDESNKLSRTEAKGCITVTGHLR
jgi:hypothetical protein